MIGEHIKVGEEVTVKRVCFNNVLGGTEILGLRARVKITKAWEDYECGWRFHGKLLDDKAIKRIEKKAGLDAKLKAQVERLGTPTKRFKNVVYVSEFDIVDPVLRKMPLNDYIITVKGKPTDQDDIESSPVGEHEFRGVTEDEALDAFHSSVPIAMLDDFDISIRKVR